MDFAGSSAPTDWLLCDGAAVSRAVYAGLFAVIGTTYGAGDGSTTFNVPNAKGRVTVGRDAGQSEFDTLAETGGAKTHTLTTSEMPSHSHGVTDPGHTHSLVVSATLGGGQLYAKDEPNTTGTQGAPNSLGGALTGISIQNAGSGGSHPNLQPYLVLNKIIKT
jgi:microcystin-dependent protein